MLEIVQCPLLDMFEFKSYGMFRDQQAYSERGIFQSFPSFRKQVIYEIRN